MNIHTYEKLWLAAAMVLIVGFIATVAYGAIGPGVAMIGASDETIDPSALDEDPRFSDPRVEQVGEDEYEVYIVSRQFVFQPGTQQPIELPANSTVTFYVTSADVYHGFNVVGTNVNTMVAPGEVATMTVEFDEPGEYGLVCNEYCGSGHHGMEGKLIVYPEDEYENATEA